MKGTHYDEYVRQFNDLQPKIVDLSDTDAAYFFQKGLPNDYRRQCFLHDATEDLTRAQECSRQYHYAMMAGHTGPLTRPGALTSTSHANDSMELDVNRHLQRPARGYSRGLPRGRPTPANHTYARGRGYAQPNAHVSHTGTCHYCGRAGHWESNCRTKQSHLQAQAHPPPSRGSYRGRSGPSRGPYTPNRGTSNGARWPARGPTTYAPSRPSGNGRGGR